MKNRETFSYEGFIEAVERMREAQKTIPPCGKRKSLKTRWTGCSMRGKNTSPKERGLLKHSRNSCRRKPDTKQALERGLF
jgi:hypothetical protein